MGMGSSRKIYPKQGSGMGGHGNRSAYSQEIELKFEGQFVKMAKINCQEKVAMGRNAVCFCGSGKKQKKCHKDVAENSVIATIIKKI